MRIRHLREEDLGMHDGVRARGIGRRRAHRIGPDAVVMVASDELQSFGAAARQPLRFVCLDGARE
jgi:hypothetical protein